MTPEQAAAADRVRKYLRERVLMQGIHHEDIHGLHTGHASRECMLKSSDLRTILAALDAAPAPREVPRLTEGDIVSCLVSAGCIGTVKMSYESGPYDITRTSRNADMLARAIESRVRELCGVAP